MKSRAHKKVRLARGKAKRPPRPRRASSPRAVAGPARRAPFSWLKGSVRATFERLKIATLQARGSEPSRPAKTGYPEKEPGLVIHRIYQRKIFWDHETKTILLHWSRQIGKSYTLAGWAVDRLLLYPGRLVTVLSNSRANGQEFVLKVQEICRLLGLAYTIDSNRVELDARTDLSEDGKFDLMRGEVRIDREGQTGRILVLAANPRTARGFSGDLILDEFAFHEDSRLIWEAAEPIISSNPDFLCRIASTGNGKRNMFYQMISGTNIPYYRVRRSEAWKDGEIKIWSALNGKEITPEQARAEASDKRAYDQNYECHFNDENAALLTPGLIHLAQREGVRIDEQTWSGATIGRLQALKEGELYLGQDVGRSRDLSVQCALVKLGQSFRVAAMLRIENRRLPDQQRELERICALPRFRGACIDMTGIGLGLVEYAQERTWGRLIAGVNFSSTEPVSSRLRADGRKAETARVTELMATELLGIFEGQRIEIPTDPQLYDDLRKPERLVSPGGRVSIAAVRDEGGHADHFWSLALAIRAAATARVEPNFYAAVV
jgi:phage FluMu gp28-like protein